MSETGAFRPGRCELKEADMYAEQAAFATADVVFAYATCFATSDGVPAQPALALAPVS